MDKDMNFSYVSLMLRIHVFSPLPDLMDTSMRRFSCSHDYPAVMLAYHNRVGTPEGQFIHVSSVLKIWCSPPLRFILRILYSIQSISEFSIQIAWPNEFISTLRVTTRAWDGLEVLHSLGIFLVADIRRFCRSICPSIRKREFKRVHTCMWGEVGSCAPAHSSATIL